MVEPGKGEQSMEAVLAAMARHIEGPGAFTETLLRTACTLLIMQTRMQMQQLKVQEQLEHYLAEADAYNRSKGWRG